MGVEANLRRNEHKALLLILKFIPMVTSACYALNILLAWMDIDAAIMSHICGMSLLPWVFILIATYVFRFCAYHRMFLYYILVNDLLNMTDYYIGIPVEVSGLMMIHLVVICVFLFLILYFYVKSHKNPVSKTA
jgi:hypothetical protein